MKTVIEKLNGIENGIKTFNERLVLLETKVEDIDQRTHKGKISLPGLEDEKQKFSLFKAIKAIIANDWTGAEFEREVFMNTKDLNTGTGSQGGYLVPAEAITDMIEMLRANSVVMAAGATVMDNLSGSPVEIPKQTGGATGYWVAENAAITASDPTFGQIQLTPKQAAALIVLSNRLLRLSNPSVEDMIRKDLAQTIALLIDYAALRGTGGNQPTGVSQVSGINTIAIGANGGDFTFDHYADMEYELEADNALRGSLAFITHPKIVSKLKKQKVAQFSGDTGGDYVVVPMADNKIEEITGYKWLTTTQLPTNLTKGTSTDCTEVYFGNWQELIIGQWGGLEIKASEDAAFANNQLWIRVIQEVDIAVRHPESFCLCSDARTN